MNKLLWKKRAIGSAQYNTTMGMNALSQAFNATNYPIINSLVGHFAGSLVEKGLDLLDPEMLLPDSNNIISKADINTVLYSLDFKEAPVFGEEYSKQFDSILFQPLVDLMNLNLTQTNRYFIMFEFDNEKIKCNTSKMYQLSTNVTLPSFVSTMISENRLGQPINNTGTYTYTDPVTFTFHSDHNLIVEDLIDYFSYYKHHTTTDDSFKVNMYVCSYYRKSIKADRRKISSNDENLKASRNYNKNEFLLFDKNPDLIMTFPMEIFKFNNIQLQSVNNFSFDNTPNALLQKVVSFKYNNTKRYIYNITKDTLQQETYKYFFSQKYMDENKGSASSGAKAREIETDDRPVIEKDSETEDKMESERTPYREDRTGEENDGRGRY